MLARGWRCPARAAGRRAGVPGWAPGPGARGPAEDRRTHPLLLPPPAAGGPRGGGRGAVPELGRLPGPQQAAREPAGPLAGHLPPPGRAAGPGRVPPALSAPTFSRTAGQEAEPGAVPRRFLALLARGGFSLSHPDAPTPSLRLCKLRAPPGARGQLDKRPRPGGGASGAGTAGRAGGRSWPAWAVLAAPGGRREAGEGAGRPLRASGGACPQPSPALGGSSSGCSSGRIC